LAATLEVQISGYPVYDWKLPQKIICKNIAPSWLFQTFNLLYVRMIIIYNLKFIQKPFPYSPSLPTATETRIIKKKKQPLRFPVTSLNQKDLLLKIDLKQYVIYQFFRY
jgi:hypothetical protein